MPAYVSRPAVVLPPHLITTAEILADIEDHNAGHPRLGMWRRVIANSGVDARCWMRPLSATAAPSGVGERALAAFGDCRRLGAQAAREALAAADLGPGAVDCVITSHTSSWSVPSLDVALVYDLGLRSDVARLPLATLACAGGAQALIRAAHHVRANPNAVVLVVVAEQLSAIYHRSETSTESMIYKVLFGDSAAACVVTGSRRGPGFAIEDTFEHVLPDSADRYWGRIDADGLHFDSTRKAARAAADAVPHLRAWLGDRGVDWAVIHPGGPRIILDIGDGLGLDPHKAGARSTESLRENGNLGGAAVLDVLRRTHAEPPAAGMPGAMVAVGPGFVTAALYGRWT